MKTNVGKFLLLVILLTVLGSFILIIPGMQLGPIKEAPKIASELGLKEGKLFTDKDSVGQMVKKLTLDEKIGQLIIGGFEGTTITEDIDWLIREQKLGGVILFANNLQTPEQTVVLLNWIKFLNKENDVPLFVSVDQEGGRVTRLPGLIDLPTNQEIGSSGKEDGAYVYGQLLANQLHAFGFNMNFAPVLDINSNINNPVIGDRSFGETPQVVSSYGVEMMKAMQDSSIIPVVKHFPGHGDTHEDSHESLPIINKGLEDLVSFEWIPFEQAMAQGVETIMTAHIKLPKIDDVYPATLSPAIIDGILRERFGFDGIVITDDMTMGAITETYGIGNAAVLAIQAGVDIVLIAHGTDSIGESINNIKAAVLSGEISEERVDESVERILHLKEKYGVDDGDIEETVDVEQLNKEIEAYMEQLNDDE